MAEMKDDIETLKPAEPYAEIFRLQAKVAELEASWQETIRANAEECSGLTAERDRLQAKVAELEKEIFAVRKSWSDFADNVRQKELAVAKAERDSLRAKLDRAKEDLSRISSLTPAAANASSDRDLHLTVKAIADTTIAELSADAPDQQAAKDVREAFSKEEKKKKKTSEKN